MTRSSVAAGVLVMALQRLCSARATGAPTEPQQGATASPTTTASTQDDAAIRDVVRRYVNAREARDPAAIGAMFTADADQLVSSRRVASWTRGARQGHARLVGRHRWHAVDALQSKPSAC